MKVTTADRLKEIMQSRRLRQVDILELCKPYCTRYNIKLQKNDLSQYVSGKVSPSQYKLTVLGLALNVSEVWLMGYEVPMDRTERNWELDAEEQLLLALFRTLPEERRKLALEVIRTVSTSIERRANVE